MCVRFARRGAGRTNNVRSVKSTPTESILPASHKSEKRLSRLGALPLSYSPLIYRAGRTRTWLHPAPKAIVCTLLPSGHDTEIGNNGKNRYSIIKDQTNKPGKPTVSRKSKERSLLYSLVSSIFTTPARNAGGRNRTCKAFAKRIT